MEQSGSSGLRWAPSVTGWVGGSADLVGARSHVSMFAGYRLVFYLFIFCSKGSSDFFSWQRRGFKTVSL